MYCKSSSLYLCNIHQNRGFAYVKYIKKVYREIQILLQRAWEMIYPNLSINKLLPHLAPPTPHLDSRSHSSEPAKRSKNSTERWNKFFHFSAHTSSKPCETGACTLTQSWSPLAAGRAQARVAISIKAAALATAPWPGPLQLEIKEKNLKHANNKKPTPRWHPDELHYRVPFFLLWFPLKLF